MTKKPKKAAAGRKKKVSRPMTVHEELGQMAKALNARLDAEEEYTRRMNEKYKNEPMTSVPVWFVHRG